MWETAHLIEAAGLLIGLAYLVAEYKAHISLWYIGILMSLFYVVIFSMSTLYANACIYGYNLGANIYGLVLWLRARQRGLENTVTEAGINRCPKAIYAKLSGVFSLCLFLIIPLLVWANGFSVSVCCDAVTAALGVIAMWLIAHKYLEHWYLWIVVNSLSVVMCVWTELYFSAIMFAVYAVVSVFGLRRWKRLIKN